LLGILNPFLGFTNMLLRLAFDLVYHPFGLLGWAANQLVSTETRTELGS